MKNRTKINKLITSWIPGAVYSVKWLVNHGFTYSNLQNYKSSGWLTPIGSGAVIKNGDEIQWQGAIWSLQRQLNLPVHVGGRTAIEYAGSAQYLTLGKQRIILVAEPKTKLPTWFKKTKWNAEIILLQSALFDDTLNERSDIDAGLTIVEFGQLTIKFSSRERAILEYLDQVPERYSFKEAAETIENLMTLRPKVVQNLLSHCTSVKTKRLFLAFSEKSGHSWLKKLDLSKVNLGSGSRQLVSGGEFDNKYKITIGNARE